MTGLLVACAAAYLAGAVPFGLLAGRLYGIDLRAHGSRNLGATNAWRVLGWRAGLAVFALDFAKGALPVAAALPLAGLSGGAAGVSPQAVRALAGLAAFLGHLFPIYTGFRGGKGVATGAGLMAVLAPPAFGLAISAWLLTFVATRTVSAASLAAAGALGVGCLTLVGEPLGADWPVTALALPGSLLVAARHRANVVRIIRGEEMAMAGGRKFEAAMRALHAVSLGLWAGGAAFFSFVAAPEMFRSFPDVVASSPSDRTAGVDIVPPGTTDESKKALGSALAGAAVGPVFPKFYGFQLGCGLVALATAVPAWRADRTRLNRARVICVSKALAAVGLGWLLSGQVGRLRMERYSPDEAVASRARTLFAPAHLVSLGLSAYTTGFALAALGMAPWLGERRQALPADQVQ